MKLIFFLLALIVLACATEADSLMAQLGKLKEVENHYNTAAKGIANINQQAIDVHQEMRRKENEVATQRSVEARVPSPTCQVAIDTFLNATGSVQCQGFINDYFSALSTTAQKGAAVDGYCGQCSANVQTSIRAVLINCNTSADLTFFQRLSFVNAGFYSRYMCSTDQNGNRCAKVLVNLNSGVFNKAYSDLTSDDLNQVCSTCVTRAIRILATAGQVPTFNALVTFAALRVICVQVRGEYCVLKIRSAQQVTARIEASIQNGQFNSADFEALLNIVCYPCFRAVFARITAFGINSGSVSLGGLSVLTSVCRKDPGRKFCLVRIFDAARRILPSLLSGSSSGFCANLAESNGTSCDTDTNCKNSINQLINDGGCCWAIFADLSFRSGPGSSADNAAKVQFYNTIRRCTGRNVPEPCPSVASGRLTITYSNLDVNQINSRLSQFRAQVLADVAASFGLDSFGEITISAVAGRKRDSLNSTTTVVINSATVPGTAAGSLTDTSVTCDNVCSNFPALDPSADITVSNRASDVTVTSASSVVSASLVLVAALFVLQFFF